MKADPTKLAKGTEVTCEIVWKDGRRTHGRGKLLFVDGDKAYVETTSTSPWRRCVSSTPS